MAESFKDTIVDLKMSAPVAVIEYFQTKIDLGDLILFVESVDDEKFYASLINLYLSEVDFHVIRCGNKKGVISTHRFLSSRSAARGEKARIFCCDTDFDIFINRSKIENVFYTDWYSVESYLICIDFFDFVLKSYCNIYKKRERMRICAKIFSRFSALSHGLAPLFAAMIFERQEGGDYDFDTVIVNKFLTFDASIGEFVPAISIESAMAEFALPSESRSYVNEIENSLHAYDVRLWVRGRQAWQLIRKIVRCEVGFENIKDMSNYMSINGLNVFARGCGIPASFLDHLKKHDLVVA